MLNTIPVIVLFQISAVILTAFFYTVLSASYSVWLYSVYIFGFSHYFLATFYSRHKLNALLVSPRHCLALLFLLILGYLNYEYISSITLFFGLHHALSEAYLRQRIYKFSVDETLLSPIQATSFIFHLCGFILLINSSAISQFDNLTLPALLVFIGSGFYFVRLIWQQKPQLNSTQLLSITGSELILMLVLLISLLYPITFLQIVFYHFTFWAIMPFLRLASGEESNTKPLMIYISLALVSLIFFTAISPIYVSTFMGKIVFQKWFLIFSYAHITLSFATSIANPAWLNACFKNKELAV